MTAFDVIRTTRAIRSFDSKPVPDNVVAKILNAGRLTQSAKNLQPWKFIVIKNRETLRAIGALASTGAFIADASFAIAICLETTNQWHDIDGGRAMQNMKLTAWEEGVGTCWVGHMDWDKVRDLLAVPKNLKLLTVLPFGYPSIMKTGKKKNRKHLTEVAYSEKYGNVLKLSN